MTALPSWVGKVEPVEGALALGMAVRGVGLKALEDFRQSLTVSSCVSH